MIHLLERQARALRRLLSRNEWSLRLLRLPRSKPSSEPGLLLIQIDGLARPQLEKALRRHRMPFLRSLLGEGYALHSVYSGLPSTTPAAQAEFFYGVPGAVPAFGYRRSRDGENMHMLKAECAGAVERELETAGAPLLMGGSCYSNIYTGGAAEPHFCASQFSISHWLKGMRRYRLAGLILLNFAGVARLLALLAVEALLAVYDAVRGALALREYKQEFLFLFSRVIVGVLGRELITAMASVDATRGLPVIHANFSGYDEQSHRRGPSSALAHFTLRGIDRAARRIVRAARRSPAREYEIWVYSDHGQESVVPYVRLTGETLAQTVARLTRAPVGAEAGSDRRIVRSQDPMGGRLERILARPPQPVKRGRGDVVVAALGPVAHIYLPGELGADPGVLARKLVQAGAPMALVPLEAGGARAHTPAGTFVLPQDAETVLGRRHPFLRLCGEDLARLARHPDAGDVVLCGWNPRGPHVTFAFENGAHGGPGDSETHAFALLPGHREPHAGPGGLRHSDLRAEALAVLGRGARERSRPGKSVASRLLRVMTYNVHGLAGMDGVESPDRIARVIATFRPHVIALQECWSFGDKGQLREICDRLVEQFRYPDTLDAFHDAYGNALVAVFPWEEAWKEPLPAQPRGRGERRGAMGGLLKWNGSNLRFCNTHFGLGSVERLLQARALRDRLFPEGALQAPLVLAGDFNAGPGSAPLGLLGAGLHDGQRASGRRPRNTFFGRMPLTRIDHILLSPSLRAAYSDVPRNHLTLLASDHLPLIVDVEVDPP